MAIVPAIPGLKVTVEVAGEALPEYDYEALDAQLDTVAKYIEAPSGAEFEIRYVNKEPYDPRPLVHLDIMLDGNYVQVPFSEWAGKDGGQGYKYVGTSFKEDGNDCVRKFRFADLVVEENDQPVTEEAKRRISGMGQIVLYFYYTQNLEEVAEIEVPRLEEGRDEAIGHKAMKAAVTPGDSLAYQTSFSAREEREVTYSRVMLADNEPFTTFTFHYRSTDALKSLGIIARTPSPSPEPQPEERDVEDMSAEELRAALRRIRDAEQLANRVKREREESVATVVGDDGEVVWVGTKPKRARSAPGPGDEVVEVEE